MTLGQSTVNDVSFWSFCSITVHPQPPSIWIYFLSLSFPSTPSYPALLKYYYRLVHIYMYYQIWDIYKTVGPDVKCLRGLNSPNIASTKKRFLSLLNLLLWLFPVLEIPKINIIYLRSAWKWVKPTSLMSFVSDGKRWNLKIV